MDQCDCPACSGVDPDPPRFIDSLVEASTGPAAEADPLEAEMMASVFLALGEPAEGFEDALAGAFVPAVEARASTNALAWLLAIGSVADDPAAKAARAAADRLVDAGVSAPSWAAELAEPVTVADCRRHTDPENAGSMLTCVFHRAGRPHAAMLTVDHGECGAARQIFLLEPDRLSGAVEAVGANLGFELVSEDLDSAEFRWHVEDALDARAVHDADDLELHDEADEAGGADEEGRSYRAMALLLRARMNALPVPDRPKRPHGAGGRSWPAAPGVLGVPRGVREASSTVRSRRARRKEADGPAPVYQVKVGLRGAKPPIWRRMEVPADTGLARLHAIIQTAFGWDDSHLHVFETPYGRFGRADRELGHRAEAPVTLEQVAPGAGSKILYRYDFGDDWEHDIVVEKVLDRDPAVSYPRCTGGRRAAPPEDCGGIWGYEHLVEILADPDHPEHEDRLEWLGLGDPADFDPSSFSAADVTQALSLQR